MPSPNHVHKSTRVRRRIRSVADLSRSDRRNLWARALDVLLIVILAASPLVFGGRYDGGKFVFVLLVAVAMCVWAIGSIVDRSCRWYGSHALWLVGVGAVLLALQLAPRGQSPPLAESLLPAWSSADSVGAWRQATFTPAETRGGMVMLLAYGGLFFLAVQRMRSIGDVERMLAAMGLVVLGLAVLGLLQYLASNERYWWFYQHPWRSPSNVVKGPFDNRNHFAHFLALGLGPLMWWWLRRANVQHESSRPQRIQTTQLPARAARATIVGAVAMAIVIFAALMTFSRAGCLMILVALAISTVAYLRIGWIGKKPAVAMLGCAVLVATALSIHGYGGLANRLDDYAMGSVDSLDRSHARRKIWAANIAGIRKNDVLGAGVGSHRHLYPVYLKSSPTTEYTHAESGYLQLLLEAGWPGLVLLLIGIAVASKWALAGWSADTSASDGRRIYACAVPIAAGLAVCALHSFVDFVWYITACVAMAVLLAACACRLCGVLAESDGVATPNGFDAPGWLRWTVATFIIVGGVSMVHDRLGPAVASVAWDQYLCVQESMADDETGPDDADSQEASIRYLATVTRWYPEHARANLRLAAVYLQKFQRIQNLSDNALSISQIREAVIRADFLKIAQQQSTAPGDETNRGDLAQATRQLRDQWLDKTLTFTSLASDMIKRYDSNKNGTLEGAEFDEARAVCQPLRAVAESRSIATEQIAAACREYYRGAHDGLYLAYQCTLRGLSACPLQGEGYLLLAELCFLEDAGVRSGFVQRRKRLLVNQALRLRPWDGDVLLVAGKEALQANRQDLAAAFWRRSFQSGPAHRARLVQLFVAQGIPLDFVEQQFSPVLDAASCDLILAKYESAGINTDAPRFMNHMASTARRDAEAGGSGSLKKWLLAYKAYRLLGDRTSQIHCVKQAAAYEPNVYGVRQKLTLMMLEHALYAEAEPHARWCLRRRPNDESMRRVVATILNAKPQRSGVELASGQAEVSEQEP